MLRHLLVSLVLGCSLTFAGGCRSCQSCHDYDGPVADCENCGCGRAGSASGGYASSDCGPNGCAPSGEYDEEPPVMTEGEVEYP